MFQKALLITNGKAGQAQENPEIQRAIQLLSTEIPQFKIIQTAKQGDAEQIAQEQGEQCDLLIVLGGDGTVHECINGLMRLTSPPVIGILPSGTCNDFARSLSIPMEFVPAAEAILTGHLRRVDIGQVNQRFFTNFCGLGLITEASNNINPLFKDWLGKLSYYISALQALQKPVAFRFKLNTPTKAYEGEAVMIVAANGCFLGTKALPNWGVLPDDGELDVFIVRQAGLQLLKEWMASAANFERQDVDSSIMEHFRTSELLVETEQVLEADTDGEVYLQTPLSLTLKKQALKFAIGYHPVE